MENTLHNTVYPNHSVKKRDSIQPTMIFLLFFHFFQMPKSDLDNTNNNNNSNKYGSQATNIKHWDISNSDMSVCLSRVTKLVRREIHKAGGEWQIRHLYDTSSLEKLANFLFWLFFLQHVLNNSKTLPYSHSSKTLVAVTTDLVEALMGAFNLCMAADALKNVAIKPHWRGSIARS